MATTCDKDRNEVCLSIATNKTKLVKIHSKANVLKTSKKFSRKDKRNYYTETKSEIYKANIKKYCSLTKDDDYQEISNTKTPPISKALGQDGFQNTALESYSKNSSKIIGTVKNTMKPVGYLPVSHYNDSARFAVATDDKAIHGTLNQGKKSKKVLKPICKQKTVPLPHDTKISRCTIASKSQPITAFFPIRRSSRKTTSTILKEQESHLIKAVLSQQEDGLKVVEFVNRGRGVVADKKFFHGDFVVEYAGELITWKEAKQRELEYALDPAIGCYMYYFHSRGKNYCIDATAESGRLGRLLNHSRKAPNCHTRLIWVPNECGHHLPRLVILAKQDIEKNEELLYDYGDRDKEAIKEHPWLKS